MPSGRHRGVCLETEVDRNYRFLSLSELSKMPPLLSYNPKSFHFIANFKHAGKFWVAVMPKFDAVDRVIYQLQRVPPKWVAAHTMLRVTFKPGKEVTLFSQTDRDASPVRIDSIYLSNGAFSMRGGPRYNLYNAARGLFALSKKMGSTEEILSELALLKQDIDQYLITFPNEMSAQSYWDFALKFYHDPDVEQIYNTFDENCSTTLFAGFDRFIDFDSTRLDWATTVVPVLTIQALKDRAMITKSSRMKSLNEEFGRQKTMGEMPEIKIDYGFASSNSLLQPALVRSIGNSSFNVGSLRLWSAIPRKLRASTVKRGKLVMTRSLR